MFKSNHAFSSFSVDNLDTAKNFYANTLGLVVEDMSEMKIIHLKLAGDMKVMIYPKTNHVPATYTCLNFVVENIDNAVSELVSKGLVMERYDMPDIKTDDKGIARWPEGPAMAWFKDPAGNILAVMEEKK